MTRLSVNINKIATLRNARGGEFPNVVQTAIDCEKFGAQGITIHPRPDERHIKRKDVYDLKKVVNTEFNIEGYPSQSFMEMVLEIKPEQVTLVPDKHDAITSDAGWDVISNFHFLSDIVKELKRQGIRTSIFIDCDIKNIEHAAKTGTNRIELYTEPYATEYITNKEAAIKPYIEASRAAKSNGIELNAGHDLSLVNLEYFSSNVIDLVEVSIGHALICDALYFGLDNTIKKYLNCLNK